jgi:hypothetical protein
MIKFDMAEKPGCSGFGSFKMKIKIVENTEKTRRLNEFEASSFVNRMLRFCKLDGHKNRIVRFYKMDVLIFSRQI